jgi:transcriptional regulator with XRE-family HTH domain
MEVDMPNETTAQKIRRLRKKMAWTQESLAEMASLTDRTIRRAESGGPMSAETRQALASTFEINAGDLLEPDADKPRPTVEMIPIQNGEHLLNALSQTHALAKAIDETDDEEIAGIIKDFLGYFEFAQIWDTLPAEERYDTGRRMSVPLRELRARGWDVYCARRTGVSFGFCDPKGKPILGTVTTIKILDVKSLKESAAFAKAVLSADPETRIKVEQKVVASGVYASAKDFRSALSEIIKFEEDEL